MLFAEGNHVELKGQYVPDIKKEVAAFANTAGGTLYIGVENNGTVIGLENPDAVLQQTTNAIRDAIRPDVTLFTSASVDILEGKSVVRVEVQKGTSCPYFLADKGLKPSGVFVRQGSSSVPASEEAIRRMIRETDGASFERNRSLIQELTFDTLQKEMDRRKLEFGEAQQKTLGILGEDGLYTNLGLLLSEQCPQSLKAAVFQGTDKQVFRDRREFHGSLLQQIQDAYAYIDYHNQTRATLNGLERVDERDYPPKAVREALLNAVGHREYSFSGSTQVNIYEDRIEFISLGGLVPGLTKEAILVGVSQSRNERLTALFYRMKLIEAYGTGIGKIFSSYEGMSVQPAVEPVDGAFLTVLPNRHYGIQGTSPAKGGFTESSGIKPQHRQVLELARKQGAVTRRELEEYLGLSLSRCIALLKEMTTEGLLKKEGDGRNTRYRAV